MRRIVGIGCGGVVELDGNGEDARERVILLNVGQKSFEMGTETCRLVEQASLTEITR